VFQYRAHPQERIPAYEKDLHRAFVLPAHRLRHHARPCGAAHRLPAYVARHRGQLDDAAEECRQLRQEPELHRPERLAAARVDQRAGQNAQLRDHLGRSGRPRRPRRLARGDLRHPGERHVLRRGRAGRGAGGGPLRSRQEHARHALARAVLAERQRAPALRHDDHRHHGRARRAARGPHQARAAEGARGRQGAARREPGTALRP